MISTRSVTTRLLPVAMLAAVLSVAGGCSTHQHRFAGHDVGAVWAAMVAVADAPDYSGDWHVTENIVTSDRSAGIIDINRALRRTVIEADGRYRAEQQAWQFRCQLMPGDPPLVEFQARNPSLPVQVHAEAERFFADLRAVLAGVPRQVRPRQPQFQVPVRPDDVMPGEPQQVDNR